MFFYGARNPAPLKLSGPPLSAISTSNGAQRRLVLRMTSAEQVRSVKARSAIVHEPLPRLYEALPLVSLDAKARRFWRRVFRLVRIPGGRYLLGRFGAPHARPAVKCRDLHHNNRAILSRA